MDSIDLFVPVIFLLGIGFIAAAFYMIKSTIKKGSNRHANVDVDTLMGGSTPPAHSLFGSPSHNSESSHNSSHTSHDHSIDAGASIVGGIGGADASSHGFGGDAGGSIDSGGGDFGGSSD